MLLSTPLLLEYEAVCQREEHRLAAGLTRKDAESFLDGLAGLAEPVTVHFLWRPRLWDAGDEMVLEAAVNGQAQAIVGFNHREYGNAPSRFGILLLAAGWGAPGQGRGGGRRDPAFGLRRCLLRHRRAAVRGRRYDGVVR